MPYPPDYEKLELIDALKTAIDALKRIAESDPGPEYHIAGIALDQIPDHLKEIE